jgi:hypothetical protein
LFVCFCLCLCFRFMFLYIFICTLHTVFSRALPKN